MSQSPHPPPDLTTLPKTLTLDDVGLTVIAGMTTPRRAGKAPRPVWTVAGNVGPWSSLLRDLGAHAYRHTFSFWQDPTADILDAIQTTATATYAEQQDARRARAQTRSDRHAALAVRADDRAADAFRSAHDATAMIPFGQPILVGHHSERRHRAALARHDARMRRGVEASRTADYHRHRAEAAASTASTDYTPGFCQRRINDATSDEQRQYWRDQLDAIGGIPFPRDVVRPGDDVRPRSHTWARVVRCNPLTVSVQWMTGPLTGMTGRYPYAEITDHRRPTISDDEQGGDA